MPLASDDNPCVIGNCIIRCILMVSPSSRCGEPCNDSASDCFEYSSLRSSDKAAVWSKVPGKSSALAGRSSGGEPLAITGSAVMEIGEIDCPVAFVGSFIGDKNGRLYGVP